MPPFRLRRRVSLLLLAALMGDGGGVVARALRPRARSGLGHRQPRRQVSSSPRRSLYERLLRAEYERRPHNPAFAAVLRQRGQKKLQGQALLALGRIGDPASIDEIEPFLRSTRPAEQRKTAAFAIGLIGGDVAIRLLTQQVGMQQEKDPAVLGEIIRSVGRLSGEAQIPFFSGMLEVKSRQSPEVVAAAAEGLGLLLSGSSDKLSVPPSLLARLVELCSEREPIGVSAAFALSRFKGNPNFLKGDEMIRAFEKIRSPDVKLVLMKVLGRLRQPKAAEVLLASYLTDRDMRFRVEAIKSLAASKMVEVKGLLPAVKRVLGESFTLPTPLGIETLQAAARWSGNDDVAFLELLEQILATHPSVWVRSTALKTLSVVNKARGRLQVDKILKSKSSPLTVAAIYSLGLLGGPEDIAKLEPYMAKAQIHLAQSAVDALNYLPDDRVPLEEKATLQRVLERGDIALTSLVSQLASRLHWTQMAPSLAAVYPLLASRDDTEAKVDVLSALGELGNRSHAGLLREALSDPDHLVGAAAAEALKKITGQDHRGALALNSRPSLAFPPLAEIQRDLKARVAVVTPRGTLRLRMLSSAPLTVHNFVELVRRGFYAGKTFHRVAPNFIVQGGDPRGDGFGGPGYTIADEPAPIPQQRGMVGMATIGKDTGGSQFYINLSPNYHVNAKYTLFAEVVSGSEILDRIEKDDRILAARVE